METTSVVYATSGEHLTSSMLNGVVAPGSQSRTFKKGTRMVVLDVIPKGDEAWVAMAESEGELAKRPYGSFWPQWSPKTPANVKVSKVKFITGRHRIQRSEYGKLTQTNIRKDNLDRVVAYLMQREAEK